MVIKITDGSTTITSLSSVDSITMTPDDRLELVKLIDGAIIQDGWQGQRKEDGDTIACNATFSPADFAKLKSVWNSRKTVTVVLGDETISNCHIVIKSYTYVDRFESYKNVSLEVWRV